MPAPQPRMHGLVHAHGGPDPIGIAWETVGAAPLTVFGNDGTGGGTPSSFSEAAGRKVSSKFTLAAPATLKELHAFVLPPSVGSTQVNSYVIHLYADSSGLPGALVANTAVIGPYSGSAFIEISETGLTVPLTAGDYWIGLTFQGAGSGGGAVRYTDATPVMRGVLSGAAVYPPSNPYGTASYTANYSLHVWALTS